MASPRVPASAAGSAPHRPDLGAWMAAHGPRLRRYFSRRAPRAEAEDLVQDVFLRVQAAQLDEPIIEVERYLFTVAHNVLVSRARRLGVRAAELRRSFAEWSEAAEDLSPERIVGARQDYARAMAVIERLPPRTRMAFRLNRMEDLSYGAIAERMGISKDSVKELLRRAHAHLDQALKGV